MLFPNIGLLKKGKKYMMLWFYEILDIFKNKNVPPIMRGTKVIIKQIAREERRLANLCTSDNKKNYSMTRPKEDFSEFFTKYVNKDFNKESYLFIKSG